MIWALDWLLTQVMVYDFYGPVRGFVSSSVIALCILNMPFVD